MCPTWVRAYAPDINLDSAFSSARTDATMTGTYAMAGDAADLALLSDIVAQRLDHRQPTRSSFRTERSRDRRTLKLPNMYRWFDGRCGRGTRLFGKLRTVDLAPALLEVQPAREFLVDLASPLCAVPPSLPRTFPRRRLLPQIGAATADDMERTRLTMDSARDGHLHPGPSRAPTWPEFRYEDDVARQWNGPVSIEGIVGLMAGSAVRESAKRGPMWQRG